MERWFNDEFERPGLEASGRLIRGRHLSRDDWHAMVRFVALQHLRTPQSFFEAMRRWDTNLPDVLNSTMREAVSLLDRARASGVNLGVQPKPVANTFAKLITVKFEPNPDASTGGSIMRAEILAGRRLWLASIRHLLTGPAMEKLLEHQWSVLQPAFGLEWPMTDDPSLRLNYYGAERFDFDGGWGKRGSEIMMAVSPRHLLYTQVGKPSRRRQLLSLDQTARAQQLLTKRAYRWVFGTEPYPWVSGARPRAVDSDRFSTEREMWNRWHIDQVEAETGRACIAT